MSVYGNASGLVDESASLKGDAGGYSAAKVEAERLARNYPPVIHLRPGIVYGPGSPIWSERIGRWLMTGRLGDLGGAGSGVCNLVHVDDVVEAILRALVRPGIEGHAFNLSMSDAPTWNEYFRLFAQALGTPPVSISRPRLLFELNVLGPPLKLAELVAQRARLRWEPPPPIRPWLLRVCAEQMRLDARKAERLLDITWTPLDRGLRGAAKWVRERCLVDHGERLAVR